MVPLLRFLRCVGYVWFLLSSTKKKIYYDKQRENGRSAVSAISWCVCDKPRARVFFAISLSLPSCRFAISRVFGLGRGGSIS